MQLVHLIAVNHNPPEILEDISCPAELADQTKATLMRRYETVFELRRYERRNDVTTR
jgi:hypothetical protein